MRGAETIAAATLVAAVLGPVTGGLAAPATATAPGELRAAVDAAFHDPRIAPDLPTPAARSAAAFDRGALALPDPSRAWREWTAAERATVDLSRKLAARTTTPATSGARGYDEGADGDGNDTMASADEVPLTGDTTVVHGTIDVPPGTLPAPVGAAEDDGTIATGRAIDLSSGPFVAATRIGDGPHGRSEEGGDGSGDFDWYRVPLAAGQTISLEVLRDGDSLLDPAIEILDPSGSTTLAYLDDRNITTWETYGTFTAPEAGTYHLLVTAALAFQEDVTDSGSGNDPYASGDPGYPDDMPAEQFGDYRLTVWPTATDVDVFAMDLPANALLDLRLEGDGGAALLLATAADGIVHGSQTPPDSLGLPVGHPTAVPGPVVALPRVTATGGRHTVAVIGAPGGYTLTLRRLDGHAFTERPGRVQEVFLDFDGHRLTPRDVFGFGNDAAVDLSAATAFLDGSRIPATSLDQLIDLTTYRVEEVFADLAAEWPGDWDVVVRNSRDHADPAGDPDALRIVIGGTRAELGVETIGLAQSIDVGNYRPDETAVVLLDLLAGPGDQPTALRYWAGSLAPSLWPIYAAHAIGSIAAHEAGHTLGSFHTDVTNDFDGVMDQGGDYQHMFGLGDDGTFGTDDDVRAVFTRDAFSPFEGFIGVEDTRAVTERGLEFDVTTPAALQVLGGETAVTAATAADAATLFTGDANRLAGENRYDTAAAIVAAAFPGTARTVYVATGRNFPDALAGASAAARFDAPVLLTEPTALPAAIRAQLVRLAPTRVKVLGGAAAVSDQVVAEIQAATGAVVQRLAGESRYETAAAISADAFPVYADVVYVATGGNFPDALAGAAAAAAENAPVLLTRPDVLPGATLDLLLALAPFEVRILGGTSAVSDEVAASIAHWTGASVERLAGTDRYATAATIIDRAFPRPVPSVLVATGTDFPDALAGAAAAAALRAPVVLVRPDAIPDGIRPTLARLGATPG